MLVRRLFTRQTDSERANKRSNTTWFHLKMYKQQAVSIAHQDRQMSPAVPDSDKNSSRPPVSHGLSANHQTNLPTIRPPPTPNTTHHTPTLKLASPTNPSPFASAPLWDPPDEEWAEIDGSRLARTFVASFRDPAQYTGKVVSQQEPSALSRLASTLTSFLPFQRGISDAEEEAAAAAATARDEQQAHDEVLAMLQNPYYTCPSGDVCDQVMRRYFLSGSRVFRSPSPRTANHLSSSSRSSSSPSSLSSSSSSPRHMHVIDLALYFCAPDGTVGRAAHPRLCDAVATLLSHTSAECMRAFLDPGVREFVYRREVQGRKGGNVLMVRREGNEIIVSFLDIILFFSLFLFLFHFVILHVSMK